MKLLSKSIRSYLIYSTIILLIAVPLFYFVIQRFVAEEVDENLAAQKQQIISKLAKVKEDLYVITGDGGNTTVYLSNDGVILVDAKFERDHVDIMER